jgi:hypothetical protein
MDSEKGLVDLLRECDALELPLFVIDDISRPVQNDATKKRQLASYLLLKQFRSPLPRYKEIRRNGAWDEHLTKCLYKRGEFFNRYHMSIDAFMVLVRMLGIEVDQKQSRCSSGGIEPIDPNIVVACGLRWLGGESHKTNADAFHISISSSKRVVSQFICAVNSCDELLINLPEANELELLANQTTKKSTCDGIFHGCVLMIDGFLSIRNKPGDNECSNPADYYSGHKKTHGINVQALCDHTLKFRYVCVAAPGKTNDNKAFDRCTSLQAWLRMLPSSFFIVGDNAYPLSNKILTPFKGQQKQEVYNSSYNFYLSQLRIRVEMAFGRMTTKFRIMRTKMYCSLLTQSKVIEAVARLHNFIIDVDGIGGIADQPVRLGNGDNLDENDFERLGIDPLPNGVEGNMGFESVEYESDEVVSASRQQAIVQRLRETTIQRPQYNVQRNAVHQGIH